MDQEKQILIDSSLEHSFEENEIFIFVLSMNSIQFMVNQFIPGEGNTANGGADNQTTGIKKEKNIF